MSSTPIVSRECPEVSIKIASTRDEREGAFRLAYSSYLRAGLCAPSTVPMRITPYQLLPSTDIIIAELRNEVISTLSLIRDGELGLPLEAIYGKEVRLRREAGRRLAEVSCLADRRQGIGRFFGLFCELSRLMVQLADSEVIDQLLIAVHPRHARMYRRAMAFEQIGEDRKYPAVNGNRAVALCLDLKAARITHPATWVRFVGDPLPKTAVVTQPIQCADRRYFGRLAQAQEAAARPAFEEVYVTPGTSSLSATGAVA
jgi:hypothetical protein